MASPKLDREVRKALTQVFNVHNTWCARAHASLLLLRSMLKALNGGVDLGQWFRHDWNGLVLKYLLECFLESSCA